MGHAKLSSWTLILAVALGLGLVVCRETLARAYPMNSSSGPTTAQAVIRTGDDLAITINDLPGPGIESVFQRRVLSDGNVELPYVGKLKASGFSTTQLEGVIVKAFRDAHLLDLAQVSVKAIDEK